MDASTVGADRTSQRELQLRGIAAVVSLLIAGLYGLLFAGVLTVTGAEDAGRGILGVAGVLFIVVAVLLRAVRSRLFWVGAALLQVLMALMYLVASLQRDPPFEVWGLTVRTLSLVLLLIIAALLVTTRRSRSVTR